MAQQTINNGTVAGDGTGESAFAGFAKVNANFTELYGRADFSTLAANSLLGNNTGSPATPAALTASQVKTLLAISSGDVSGLGSLATASSVSLSTQATGTLQAGQFPAMTGDVTSSAGALGTTIASASVSLSKMASLAANSILGNNTGSGATPLALTATQVTAMLNALVGDSGSGGTKGLVPAPASGDAAAWKVLKADGTWAAAVGSSATTQLLYNLAGVITGDSGLTWDATNKSLTAGGGTVTTSNPVLNLAQTWNAGGVTFTADKLNITDTASASGSLLIDRQVGGVSKFSISKTGTGIFGQVSGGTYNGHMRLVTDDQVPGYFFYKGNSASFSLLFEAASTYVYYTYAVNSYFGSALGVPLLKMTASTDLTLTAAASLSWGSSTTESPDLFCYRDAANTLALRNSTNAQRFNLANTYASSTSYEYVSLYAASNVFYLDANKGSGGGTQRPLLIGHGSVALSALPAAAAGNAGCRAFINDCNVALVWGTTATGGGSSKTTVWSDGTNWLIG